MKLALLLTSRRNRDDHIELGSILEMSRWSVDLEIVPSAYEEVKRWVRSLLTSQFMDLGPQPHSIKRLQGWIKYLIPLLIHSFRSFVPSMRKPVSFGSVTNRQIG